MSGAPEINPRQRLRAVAATLARAGSSPEAIEHALLIENAKHGGRLDLDELEVIANEFEVQGAVVIPLSAVKPETVSWLWRGWLPLGKLVVLDGDPGLGKSTMTLDLAARLSTGRAMPDGSAGTLGDVVVVSFEDGLADTIAPRLLAAGANTSRVHAIPCVKSDDGLRLPELPADTERLEAVVAQRNAVLVIIDPLAAILGEGVNSHRDQDIRRTLAPLSAMADRTGATVLVVRHLTKSAGGTNALHRGLGSIGIIGAARAGMLVCKDPDDESRRVLAPTKSNLGAQPDSLGFELEPASSDVARVRWLGNVHHGADALLAASMKPAETNETPGPRDEAKDFLLSVLGSGPLPSTVVRQESRDAGLAWRTVVRAKSDLGITSRKRGQSGPWEWTLPKDATGTRPSGEDPTGQPSEDWHSSKNSGQLEALQTPDPGEGCHLQGAARLSLQEIESRGILCSLDEDGNVQTSEPPVELPDDVFWSIWPRDEIRSELLARQTSE